METGIAPFEQSQPVHPFCKQSLTTASCLEIGAGGMGEVYLAQDVKLGGNIIDYFIKAREGK